MDQLQYLLEVTKGANSDTVEAFFHLHRVCVCDGVWSFKARNSLSSPSLPPLLPLIQDTQACATCLILATGPNQQVQD